MVPLAAGREGRNVRWCKGASERASERASHARASMRVQALVGCRSRCRWRRINEVGKLIHKACCGKCHGEWWLYILGSSARGSCTLDLIALLPEGSQRNVWIACSAHLSRMPFQYSKVPPANLINVYPVGRGLRGGFPFSSCMPASSLNNIGWETRQEWENDGPSKV